MSNENANQPAFPCQVIEGQAYNPGISKREYFAAMCLMGYCSNTSVTQIGVNPKEKARAALIQADELLSQLSPTK